MADLHYFPMYVADWLAGEATTVMSLEQEGAFLRLLMHSWQSKGVPCSVPADDESLAELSKLRGRWGKAGGLVRAQFEPVEGNPARLRNARLWAIYQEQSDKHQKRVRAGGIGGIASSNARTTDKKTTSVSGSNALANGEQTGSNAGALLYQPEPEVEVEPEAEPKKSFSISAREVAELTASANRGLADHEAPERRQPIARIMASSGSSLEGAEALSVAGVPLDFARAELYRAGKTAKSRSHVTSLKYLVPVVIEAWERANATAAAGRVRPPPPRTTGVQRGDKASRSVQALSTWLADSEIPDAEVIENGEQ